MNSKQLCGVPFFFYIAITVFCNISAEKPYLVAQHRFSRDESTTWNILSKSGLRVIDHKTPDALFTFRSKRVRILSNKNGITLNGKQFFGDRIVITPLQNSCIVAGKTITGTLVIVKKKEAVCLVAMPHVLAHSVPAYNKQNKVHKQVRVLLGQSQGIAQHCWHITASDGLVMQDAATKKKKLYQHLTLERKNGQLYGNGVVIPHGSSIITPVKGHLAYDNKQYQGVFIIYHDKHKSLLINQLAIEDYVCSVLKTESWPGWPLEVNKAFAITSRTYVHAMIIKAERNKQLYHVKNTNLHQTYSGHHTTQVLKLAVEQTKGVILSYEGQPILAMFDSCCGGVIPAHIVGVNFAHAPYLAHSYACTFCKNYKIYTWQAQYTWDELQKRLQKYIPQGSVLQQIKIVKKDKAGLVQEVTVKTNRITRTITGQEWYCLFKEVKSFCFDFTIKNKMLYVTGRGFGHHVGLCQWGARKMVDEGWDYKKILHFYYPQVTFMKL